MKIFFCSRITSLFLTSFVVCSAILLTQEVQAQSVQTNQGRQFNGPEYTTARLHQALQSGDFNSINNYYCTRERAIAERAVGSSDELRQGVALLNAYLQISSSIYSVDMSQLYYETKYYEASEGRAVVAITGNVTIRSSDGRSATLPYREFSAFGRDWLRLIYEDNEWKLCHNI
ncbi:MAG: hypothetical protein HLUCCA11_23955 [Phormidesmis priestleyi Ana]|uniref:DUF4440 domain-containing protein n=1 Tax=Phormidesmis priestleyi Ana TaxID=1666911 RepID=A0A0P7ZP73_9CYAN|nr:MAG: hypothetical protein HLUCCA11_23955 [Phormidesmis priestleyi Ana]